jgi:hypothetical protein
VGICRVNKRNNRRTPRGVCGHMQVVVGNPPHPCMDDTLNATPFGVVMGGRQESAGMPPLINKDEVRLAYALGEWTAQVARLLHDSDLV